MATAVWADEAATSSSRIILVDQDNVRASAGWPPARAFRDRLARAHLLDPIHSYTAMIVEVDERRHSTGNSCDNNQSVSLRARHIAPHVALSFSGPRLRADDLIARDVEYWGRQPSVTDVLVVSSDKLVRRRCGEAKNRVGGHLRLRFETGEAFAMLMPSEAGATPCADAPPSAPPAEAATDAANVEAPPAGTAADAPIAATAAGLASAVAEFVAWVERKQPGPSKSAQDVSMAGEKSRKGNKRKLGVYR